jgi:hypothetical protein
VNVTGEVKHQERPKDTQWIKQITQQ